MQIIRWGESLAVRIPDDVAQSLGLKEGDEVELRPTPAPQYTMTREEALAALDKFRWKLPPTISSTAMRPTNASPCTAPL